MGTASDQGLTKRGGGSVRNEDKKYIHSRYKEGASIHQIAQELDCHYKSVSAVIGMHRRAEDRSRSARYNIFEALFRHGHDDDFEPMQLSGFCATDAPAGSWEKIELLRQRVELGQPLWHPQDRVDYEGMTGAINPRNVT